jgi:hypothetical protein
MLRYAGYDPDEEQIFKTTPQQRGFGHRFTSEEIQTMITMANDGASSPEIGRALGVKPPAIRAKLSSMGYRLRRPKLSAKLRVVLALPTALREAAARRGITPAALIRRLIEALVRRDLIDAVLDDDLTERRPHPLGASSFPWRQHEEMRFALSPKISIVAASAPRLGGVCSPNFPGCVVQRPDLVQL